MNDTWKILLQTLLVPLAIAGVGFMINNTLQQKQMNLDKLKSTEQLIDDAFDASNPYKSFTLITLLPQLTDDKMFADNISSLISRYYITMAAQAAESGNESLYHSIADAARTFAGTTVHIADSLKSNPQTRDAESAYTEERRGLRFLQSGSLDSAQKHFEDADKKYSLFHSNSEISNLLWAKRREGGNTDTTKIKRDVMDTIRKKFSWKMDMQHSVSH